MNDEDIILIEKYLKGQLSDAENASLESRVANDDDFAQELSLQKDMIDGIERHFDNNVKTLLATTEESFQQEAKVVKPNLWLSRGIPLAAAIITFILVGYLVFKEKPTGQDLFISYYETYPNIVTPLDRSNAGDSNSAMAYYENGDFNKALGLLEKEIVSSPEEISLQFYLGICQLEVGNIDFAITELQPIAISDNQVFNEPAAWYLALAYLNAEDLEEAKKVLTSIKNSSGSAYSKRASRLLQELD